MKVTELQKNKKYWCWWMHRYLLFKRLTTIDGKPNKYIFEDFGDAQIILTPDQIEKLQPTK